MKAITVRQPWASLIAAGVKTIETRPRRTGYRGRIAIHAGLWRPPLMHLPPLSRRRNDPADRQTWLVIDTITDPKYQGPQPQGRRVPKRATTSTLFYPHEGPHGRPWDDKAGTCATEQGTAIYLPLGAVVASAVLTDCVPIVERDTMEGATARGPRVIRISMRPATLWLYRGDGSVGDLITDQLPFGDFSPGRWALLLEDIKPTTERCPWCWGTGYTDPVPWAGRHTRSNLTDCPVCHNAGDCDPVPARGQLPVPWEWTPEAAGNAHSVKPEGS